MTSKADMNKQEFYPLTLQLLARASQAFPRRGDCLDAVYEAADQLGIDCTAARVAAVKLAFTFGATVDIHGNLVHQELSESDIMKQMIKSFHGEELQFTFDSYPDAATAMAYIIMQLSTLVTLKRFNKQNFNKICDTLQDAMYRKWG